MADFADAFRHLNQKGAVTRPTWAERDLRLVIVPGVNFVAAGAPFTEGDKIVTGPYFGLVSADGAAAVWPPQIGDLLADDWILLEANKEDIFA